MLLKNYYDGYVSASEALTRLRPCLVAGRKLSLKSEREAALAKITAVTRLGTLLCLFLGISVRGETCVGVLLWMDVQKRLFYYFFLEVSIHNCGLVRFQEGGFLDIIFHCKGA